MKTVIAALLLLSLPLSAHATNIVVNGSFENPQVTASDHWDLFTSLPGWSLASGSYIEVQTSPLFGTTSGAAQGNQWVELDSDVCKYCNAQGSQGSSSIYQDLNTVAGAAYTLTFAFAARPGVDQNILAVSWGGHDITATPLSLSGLGESTPLWQYYSYTLVAHDSTTRLGFRNLDRNDSLGTFIDDVKVSPVPEPASGVLAVMGLLGFFGRRRRTA